LSQLISSSTAKEARNVFETVKTLCGLAGVSGCEEEVRETIAARVQCHADELIVDPMGNLLVFKRGRKQPARPVMLCAHMDEVGVILTGVTEEGYCKFDFVGGVDRRVVLGKRVRIGGGGVKGVIGIKAHHLVSKEEGKSVPKTEELYIDIGAASEEDALRRVALGDCGIFDTLAEEFGEGLLKARAIDDRAGCAALIKLLEGPLPVDTWFAFTVQEEVGTRGARTAAWRLDPFCAVVLEGTTAADLPGVEEDRQICRVGGGVVVPYMDGGTLYDRELYAMAKRTAEAHGIAWQTKNRVAGGTDAAAVQRSRGGVRTLALAVAVRNIHSPACIASRADLEALPMLAGLVLEEISHGVL
jgi:endoglucanase